MSFQIAWVELMNDIAILTAAVESWKKSGFTSFSAQCAIQDMLSKTPFTEVQMLHQG